MAINVSFKSQEIQDFYEGKGSTAASLLNEFRTGANITDQPKGDFTDSTTATKAAREQMTEVVKTLEQRIATFEGVTIGDTETTNDNDYPFDRVALKREFMDEVLSALIRSDFGFDTGQYYSAPSAGDPPYPTSAPVKNASGTIFGGFGELLLDAGSNLWKRTTSTYSETWDHCNFAETNGCNGNKKDFESSIESLYGGTLNLDLFYSPGYNDDTGKQTYTITRHVYSQAFTGFVPDDFSSLYTYDIATEDETDNRGDLLNPEGQQIFSRYSELIDRIFAAGDALADNPVVLPEVVTSIRGVTMDLPGPSVADRPVGLLGAGRSSYSGQLPGTPIAYRDQLIGSPAAPAGGVTITVGNTSAMDDGNGNLSGTGITGTIDYATGRYSINLAAATAADREIRGSYQTLQVYTGLRTVRVPAPTVENPNAATYRYYVFDEKAGFDSSDPTEKSRQQVVKSPVLNTSGDAVDFELGFSPNSLVGIKYYEVEQVLSSVAPGGPAGGVDNFATPTEFRLKDGVPVSGLASTFHLSPTEYLYYWNEVRIRGFRGQLNYQQAVVAEIQEDLRQANAALADLEKLAGQTDPQDADGNPDKASTLETSLLDHHQAIIAHANLKLYGPSDSHVSSSWQNNRVALKSYIDRRTADAQSASLDLQQTTNRFNNAYEVMAKLQEKMDGLIKTQLRNW
ncbi:MAG: hypothetical protein P1U81_15565 [Verrucomicrobiales bacterium]|nr:hypothetical protein [Verrucomicrobiales bacterium]